MLMDKKIIPYSRFGLIGKRLDYSFSKAYFSQKFDQLGLKDHSYHNFEISSVQGLLRFRESVNYNNASRTTNSENYVLRGLNVTIPYKQDIMAILDEISDEAKEIGAVNTISIEDNIWKGYNTDAFGFLDSLKSHLPVKGNALILGTGGASLAVAYALDTAGIPYLCVSRTPQKEYEIGYHDIDKNMLMGIGLIVNTTPLGTYPAIDDSPELPYRYLHKDMLCYDLVYNPLQTTFMKKSSFYGAQVMNGTEMLIAQAEKSWEIWNQ